MADDQFVDKTLDCVDWPPTARFIWTVRKAKKARLAALRDADDSSRINDGLCSCVVTVRPAR